jgi:hypothetical protein
MVTILQLSDIHLKANNNTILGKVDKLFDAIKNQIDESKYLFIIFSGDIAFSGQKNEYQEAKIFIEQLKKNIINYNISIQIEFIFTPGNHDCDFSKKNEVRNLIIDTIVSDPAKITDEFILTCSAVQEEYNDFIKNIHSEGHINKSASNKLFIRYEYNIDTYKIAFNSYNLAWASTKKESQSKIIYPVDIINKSLISNNDFDITVSLFHHPLHWLEHQNMRQFKELINSTSNIVMTGHEHTSTASTEASIDMKDHIEYLEAGVLQDSHNEHISSFNLLNINLSDQTQNILEFSWTSNAYTQKHAYRDIQLPFAKKVMYPLKEIYKQKLNTLGLKVAHPTKENMSLEDIFIYPDLQVISSDTKNKSMFLEENSEKFKLINRIGYTIVYGAETSGKTSLSRILQLKYKRDGLIPIIIHGKEIKSNDINSSKIKALIKGVFNKQYDCDISILEQIDKSQILIIVDDFQETKLNTEYKAKFIDILKELNYHNLLIFAHESLQLEATTEGELAKSLLDFNHYKILEFGHKLRDKLIQKWISLGQETTIDKKELLYKTREKSASINTTIGYNIVPSYPIYLLTLLQAMEANETNSLAKSSYGYYYEFLIMKYLNANSPMQPKDINTIFTYTSTLAFECLKTKQYTFVISELESFDSTYRTQKRFSPTFNIVEKLVQSNILSEYESEYKFSHDYIYYFFVAKYLSDNISKYEIQDIIKKMCKRLYRIEFANIIMFLIHHSPQNFILETIIEEAKNIFKEVSQFTFAKEELTKINSSIKKEKLKLENRTLDESRSLELEQKENSDKINSLKHTKDRDEADYNEEIQELNQFATLNVAFKMIEILGEITKNYSGSLDGDIKYELIKETYSVGLRSLKSLIEFFEINHELLVVEIKDVIAKKQYVTDDKIHETVGNMIFGMVSSISTGIVKKIAKAIASKDLIEIYQEILDEDTANMAIQLINQGIDLDFQGGLNVAKIEKLHKALQYDNNRLADSVLKKIVLEHIYMFDLDFSKKQSICAKLEIDNDNSKREMIKQIKR